MLVPGGGGAGSRLSTGGLTATYADGGAARAEKAERERRVSPQPRGAAGAGADAALDGNRGALLSLLSVSATICLAVCPSP